MAPSSCSTRIGRNARVPVDDAVEVDVPEPGVVLRNGSSIREATATPALLNTAPIGWGAQPRISPAKSSCASASRTSSSWVSVGPVKRGFGFLQSLFVDVCDDHRATVRRKLLRQSTTHTGCRARDDHCAPADRPAPGLAMFVPQVESASRRHSFCVAERARVSIVPFVGRQRPGRHVRARW